MKSKLQPLLKPEVKVGYQWIIKEDKYMSASIFIRRIGKWGFIMMVLF